MDTKEFKLRDNKTVFWFYNDHSVYVWWTERSGDKEIGNCSEAIVLIPARNCKIHSKEVAAAWCEGLIDLFRVKNKWKGETKADFLGDGVVIYQDKN